MSAKAIVPKPAEARCAWCDFENGVRPEPHFNHGICFRHKAQFYVSAGLAGSIEALTAAVLAALAERSAAR